MNKVLAGSVVRFTDGSIDVTATEKAYGERLLTLASEKIARVNKALAEEMTTSLASFKKDMEEYVVERGTWDLVSRDAILATFAKYPNTTNGSIDKPTVISLTSNALLASSAIKWEQFKKCQEMLEAFIDDNQGTGCLFTVARGKGGGVSLNKK